MVDVRTGGMTFGYIISITNSLIRGEVWDMRNLWIMNIRVENGEKESDQNSGSFFNFSSPIYRKNVCSGQPPRYGGGISMNRFEI